MTLNFIRLKFDLIKLRSKNQCCFVQTINDTLVTRTTWKINEDCIFIIKKNRLVNWLGILIRRTSIGIQIPQTKKNSQFSLYFGHCPLSILSLFMFMWLRPQKKELRIVHQATICVQIQTKTASSWCPRILFLVWASYSGAFLKSFPKASYSCHIFYGQLCLFA